MVIADISAGGAQRVFSLLANHWASRGMQIAVVTLSDPQNDFFALDPRIQRHALGSVAPSSGPGSALARNVGRIAALRRSIRETGAPCVLSFVGAMNVLCILATAGLRQRVVISERNDPQRQDLGRAWNLLRRWLYARADLVTANSQAALTAMAAYVPAHKLAFVPNPVSVPQGSAVAELPRHSVLNVGRLTSQKAQDVLIEAFAQACRLLNDPDWHLVLAGTGEDESALRTRVQRLGLGAQVHFLGQVSDPYPLYRAASIFALPSRFEGTPNALLEAMSCGVAPIVSDASRGPLEFVSDDVTGLVVPADDTAALAEALVRLMSDPPLRARLAAAAARRMQSHSFERALTVWSEVLGLPCRQPQ